MFKIRNIITERKYSMNAKANNTNDSKGGLLQHCIKGNEKISEGCLLGDGYWYLMIRRTIKLQFQVEHNKANPSDKNPKKPNCGPNPVGVNSMALRLGVGPMRCPRLVGRTSVEQTPEMYPYKLK